MKPGGELLVVCGLNREAALLREPGIRVVAGGGDRLALEARLRETDPADLRAVVSFGLAGALDPVLRVGDLVLPDRVVALGGGSSPVSAAIVERWRTVLGDATPDRAAALVGVDAPVLTPAGKRRIRETTGAAALDMESHVAGAFAARHALPFAILRVVSDTADRALPAIAGRAMRPDGSVDVLGVLRGLARDPGQIAPLVRTARDAARAFRRLGRVRGLLGPGLGLHL